MIGRLLSEIPDPIEPDIFENLANTVYMIILFILNQFNGLYMGSKEVQ